jgi:uncharacterized protein YbjT (DUF2867 family)
MILVTTAGKVGAEAARLLARDGTPARVLVRDPEKAGALAQGGVDVVTGDLNDRSVLDAAMRDVSAVILVSPAIPAQEIAVIDAVVGWDTRHHDRVSASADVSAVQTDRTLSSAASANVGQRSWY